MPDANDPVANPDSSDATAAQSSGLERGTYEIIRGRLDSYAEELRTRLEQLNSERREVFGSIPTELLSTDRISTTHNCLAQDLIPIGNQFVFGFNVTIGLKSETRAADVFAIFRIDDEEKLHADSLDLLSDPNFKHDFGQLYKYYKNASFSKFQQIGPYLYMVFQVGETARDIKTFKWELQETQLKYIDNRSDHEAVFPSQYEFDWRRTHRDLHRSGQHPHISIEDRVFVETVGGDLTIKIEDNTNDGLGIYREPVADPDQTLDDAEIFYAAVGNLILLKIRPFKEDAYRYFVFNEKLQTVTRLDSLASACILLPEDHGLIFSNGYYLQSGEHKTFPTETTDLLFEKRISSPNGEDFLFVFYSVKSGTYVLLPYNMIEQRVETPIHCNGYSIFPNGHMIYFKGESSPQKHHAVQIWQTPFTETETAASNKSDSYLYKIGNRDVVRGMSECHEIINLVNREEAYSEIYVDLVQKTNDVLDSYFWINHQGAFELGKTITEIRDTANAAVDEFEKVRRIRHNTLEQTTLVAKEVQQILNDSTRSVWRTIDEYVEALSRLRSSRGKVITLRDLKYADLAIIEKLEDELKEQTEKLSKDCVRFLLQEDSLAPYVNRVSDQSSQIESLTTVATANKLDSEIGDGANQLEMLIDIVSNLKIDDATQRTKIIDEISAIYSKINKTRAQLKNKTKSLMSTEGAAEFSSQLKLLSQAVVNYLDVCDTPARCDEYLTKMMVQVEELEGRFAEFDEFVIQLADKRDEIYAAFDSKKLQLVEARNRRATSLATAADRILKGIATRIGNLKSVDEINSYFASDLMIEKVRDLILQLQDLEESVKVDDIQSRLKTTREDAVRQLQDKNELFVDGQNLIKLGKHQFTVNVQPLDLSAVVKDERMYFHLTGTNFFEEIDSPAINTHRDIWNQAIVSENRDVYRSEYLAFLMTRDSKIAKTLSDNAVENSKIALAFMSPRYSEGYIKGVHDHDAGLILRGYLQLREQLGLLKYGDFARAIATIYWCNLETQTAERARLSAQIKSLGSAFQLFGNADGRDHLVQHLAIEIETLRKKLQLGSTGDSLQAAGYLFDEVSTEHSHAHADAIKLAQALQKYLKKEGLEKAFQQQLHALDSPLDRFQIVQQWLIGFANQSDGTHENHDSSLGMIAESAAIIVDNSVNQRMALQGKTVAKIEDVLGDHARIKDGIYELEFNDFEKRLENFSTQKVAAFHEYHEVKHETLENRKAELRLEEFRPRVLTSFVRNKLINDVYLPLVGDNLAKQIGVAGEGKRTDLMGLLLLISPPGYGKTTLMEYIANRLGLTFMKINGPAIGHNVTSLDPGEAPNVSAREEVEKLNLALEMGDNVMIYLDDIQHCNPEFLQKFISLCDATRRIEGVFKGRSRTYDLRGRKVCVVMAGNPYTESGDKFQIPDMLANRADTYNLGDVIGDQADVFELSYLENCLTANATLANLNTRSRQDIYKIIDLASGNESTNVKSVEGNFTVEEINEFVEVMKKLLRIRDVILRVNQEYIISAAQQDEYRTEPSFKLQGSYRDMNKMAERVVPIMNDDELNTLITSHYENQAQTLTTGAQANLLKFAELIGIMTAEEQQRWNDIKRTFKRNLLLGSSEGDDKVSQIIAQMTTFSEGLHEIRSVLDTGIQKLTMEDEGEENVLETATLRQVGHAVEQLGQFNNTLQGIKNLLETSVAEQQQPPAAPAITAEPLPSQKIEVINKVPQAFSNIIEAQFRILQTWLAPLLKLAESMPEVEGLVKATRLTEKQYKRMISKFEDDDEGDDDEDEQEKLRTPPKKKTPRRKKRAPRKKKP
ncbi:MAG: DNA repair ATPase [Pirellulaceae bacterium]|nr:DNA repair ATPase [Pirellulaceae bacterium]MDG2103517.1 DNA repair ATPase [Pirellulaceae bacterium]